MFVRQYYSSERFKSICSRDLPFFKYVLYILYARYKSQLKLRRVHSTVNLNWIVNFNNNCYSDYSLAKNSAVYIPSVDDHDDYNKRILNDIHYDTLCNAKHTEFLLFFAFCLRHYILYKSFRKKDDSLGTRPIHKLLTTKIADL